MFKKLILISAMFAGGALLPANAAPVLSFSPSSQTVDVGDSFSVSAILSGLESGGLDEALTAFDVTVGFDSSVLQINSLLIDLTPFYINFTGIENVSFASNSVQWNVFSVDSDSDLQAAQGDSVTLGILSFTALSAGTSALAFDINSSLTGLSFADLRQTTLDGSVTVSSVPEPTTMMLLGLGALGMVGAKRRKAHLADI